MQVPRHVFREYDIRGIVGDDLTAPLVEQVGRAYGTVLRDIAATDRPHVVTGHDNRPSSPQLCSALIAGLRAVGCNVTFVGTVPTGVLYWAGATNPSDGAIQITGSHNPAEWNGVKMTVQGRSLYGRAIKELADRIEAGDFAHGSGELVEKPVLGDYVEDVAGRFQLARPVKVAVDCGNGTAAVVAVELLARLGAEVLPIYCTSDGTFPNHHPDPTVDENLEDLIEVVREHGAELGIAFDGDGDRIGAVDEHGSIVRGDLLLLLFGLDLLPRGEGWDTLVYDVKCSQAVPEVYEAAGGTAIMWKTGHSLMKEKMKASGAVLAGELSGHICVGGEMYYGFDDALFDACLLLDVIARSPEPLSKRVAEFPAYVSTPEIRIEVDEERKFSIVEKAQRHFRERYDVNDVDGVRVLFGDGWGLLRTSNTQPVIVARYEARTEERLAEIRGEMEGWLESQGVK